MGVTNNPQPPYNERAGLPSVSTMLHEASNGAGYEAPGTEAAPPVTARSARRIPMTREWVKFSDEYAFMEVQIWVDAPMKVMEGLGPQAGDETIADHKARVLDALGRIVLAHRFDDGTPWTDEDGELPPPQDPAFWERTPQTIANAIVAYIAEAVSGHPTLRKSGGTKLR